MASDLASEGATELAERVDALSRSRRSERESDRLKLTASTEQALQDLLGLAEDSLAEDPKLAALTDELGAIRQAEPATNILVHTEYVDSQAAIMATLRQAVELGVLGGEVLAISGPDPEPVRTRITQRFAEEDDLILVSTDATAEGLNLHQRCHHLVHFELPYNPNRLEQRNGRIDRYGQRFPPQVRYLYLAGTFEERLLLLLIRKYERQRARLSFVPNTLGGLTATEAATARLLEGLANEEEDLFKRPEQSIRFDLAAEEDTGSPAYRELLAEVERAMSGYEKAAKSRAWLSEAGINAESRWVRETGEACERGARLGAVDLMGFVCAAVASESDRSDAVRRQEGGVTELVLPATWAFGLEGLPGFD